MRLNTAPLFNKHVIALAASTVLGTTTALGLDLAESPPGTVQPYVRPNVIISVDDSGSMDFKLKNSGAGSKTILTPNADGTWDDNAKRMSILKYSLKQVFNDTNLLPDKKIRLSWQTMWNNGNAPGAESVDSTGMKQNSMRVLESGHRNNFFSFIDSLESDNNTPSSRMFSQADSYMRKPLGPNSAWASQPGTTGAPYLGCRRTYHVFMSDGRWNNAASGGSQDNATNKTLPDDVVYGGSAPGQKKSALYRDTHNNTLADWAFKSWADKLQASGLTGTMEAAADYRKAAATENFGTDTSGSPAILDRYWNPRYNPATWPHMVTYTIGFSKDAITWPGSAINSPTQQVPFGYDGSFPNLVTGKEKWPAMGNENVRALDLWHAALNGRGRFYAVSKGEDLEKAFREILGQISLATAPDLSSSATSGSNVSRNDVGKYTAAYEPDKGWKGFVVADKVTPDGTTVSDPGWAGKNTADKLDALANINNRVVLAWSDKWDVIKYKGGVPFKWASGDTNLSATQKLMLQRNLDGTDGGAVKGEQRLNYIRGSRLLEGSEADNYPNPSKPYRERKSRQGDIVNSDVWYTGPPAGDSLLKGYAAFVRDKKARPPMLYVGGNDGMLHGFAAADGQEKIAYVPNGVLSRLTLLTDPQYNNKHKYFVDGSPVTGDIDIKGGRQDPSSTDFDTYAPDWRTMLVGTLGLGGKGYFVLDVTNPASFSEAGAPDLVRLDRTRGALEPAPNCGAMTDTAEKAACVKTVNEDTDIGFITARPVRSENDSMRTTQITLMNDNRWAVILGNGLNSANQRPVLLVQYLDGDKALKRVPATAHATGTGNAKDNGLSAPRVVDLNGDGRADVVYAGDNLGNMWKFDLTSEDPGNWSVAFAGSPLFTARGPAALNATTRLKVQPVSTAPTVRANDRNKIVGTGPSAKTMSVGGMMVAFGTGRNIDKEDPASVDVQTLYSVLDNTRYRVINTTKGKRLQVHPGGGTCPSVACIPAPAALGTGITVAKLAQQKFTDVATADPTDSYATVDVVDDLKEETWSNFNGWYMDLPAVGERLLKPIEFYDGSNLLTVFSQVPAKGSDVDPSVESCDSSSVDEERQYRTFVNIMDGKRPSVQIVDINADGMYMSTGAASDKDVSRSQVSKGPHTIIKKSKFENADIDAKNSKENLAALPEQSLRPNWRQIR